MAETRFDSWPGVVPKVEQVVQVKLKDVTFEARVLTRGTRDKETFFITVDSPFPKERMLELYITPSASGIGMADQVNDLKPYWRVSTAHGENEIAQIFLLN